MQSVSSSAVAQAMGSSETGVLIGTYFDGRPLYKKTLCFQVPSNGNYSISLGETGAKVVSWRGNFFQGSIDSPAWIMHIPYTYFDPANLGTMINIYVYFDPSSNKFQCSFYGSGQYASSYFAGWAVLYVEYKK